MRLAAVLVLAACGQGRARPATTPITVEVQGYRLDVELAADPDTRERGLALRRELDDDGMLLAFPEARPLALGARDTFIPLSIAFLDGDGRIMSIEDLEPFEGLARSRDAAVYALEVRQGWFAAHRVDVGTICHFSLPEGMVVR
jgi:uncharacterized membrane protein (UPF0127 family)